MVRMSQPGTIPEPSESGQNQTNVKNIFSSWTTWTDLSHKHTCRQMVCRRQRAKRHSSFISVHRKPGRACSCHPSIHGGMRVVYMQQAPVAPCHNMLNKIILNNLHVVTSCQSLLVLHPKHGGKCNYCTYYTRHRTPGVRAGRESWKECGLTEGSARPRAVPRGQIVEYSLRRVSSSRPSFLAPGRPCWLAAFLHPSPCTAGWGRLPRLTASPALGQRWRAG